MKWQWCHLCDRTAEPLEVGYVWGRKSVPDDASYIESTCPLCDLELKAARKKKSASERRRTERRKRGLEPWAPGTTPEDPFYGFRD
jgi:hypothetical protein